MRIINLEDVRKEGVSHNPEILKQVLVRNGEVPHLTNFSKSTLIPGQVSETHSHPDMYEIFLVESGSGEIHINSKPLPIRTGTCLVVSPGEAHRISNNSSVPLALIYFGIKA